MYVESVTMTNFRCFEKAEATFVYPGKEGLPEEALNNVTLLMGINGAGKTSLLKAVTLSLLSESVLSLGYVPYCLVRLNETRMATTAIIRVAVQSNTEEEQKYILNESGPMVPKGVLNPVRIRSDGFSYLNNFESHTIFVQSWSGPDLQSPQYAKTHEIRTGIGDDLFNADTSPMNFLLGYGASRRSEYIENLDSQRSRRRHPRFQRVAGLFEDFITLYPLGAWYPTLKSKARVKDVRELLNTLLPKGTNFIGDFKDGDALFKHNGVTIPFGALSDGYRSYIALVADILYHMQYVCPTKAKLKSLSGVIMIDDIDVHLHPEWQRIIVPKLATTFPKMQFIITSHSPLVIGTLHAANIRVVEDDQIHEYTERVHGLSADQLLMSSYFGLSSPRSPDTEKKLNKKAARVADTRDPKDAIAFLRELAGKTNGQP